MFQRQKVFAKIPITMGGREATEVVGVSGIHKMAPLLDKGVLHGMIV